MPEMTFLKNINTLAYFIDSRKSIYYVIGFTVIYVAAFAALILVYDFSFTDLVHKSFDFWFCLSCAGYYETCSVAMNDLIC